MKTTAPRLAIALSGGVVRGAAHLGVLHVLDQEGLSPGCVAGTSAGALVGALYAAGYAPRDIQAIAEEFKWTSLARPTWRLWESLLDMEPLDRLLRETLRLTTFDALHRRFAAVACDLISGRPVTFTDGDVARAVIASCTVPALFPTVDLDGAQLVDGGIVDNLPADAARRLGCDVLVGVDVLPTDGTAERAGNLLEVLFRSRYLAIRANHPPPEAFDHLIRPRVEGYSIVDFGQLDDLVRRGEEAAVRAVPAIRAALEGAV